MSLDKYKGDYWNKFYSSSEIPSNPSSFAEYVLQKVNKEGTLVDLGCGNGRDSVFFAKHGINLVYAIDLSQSSIDKLNKTTADIDHIQFIQGDFSELKSKSELNITDLDAVYSRFTLHAVNKVSASRALKWAYDNLDKDGLLLVEARSTKSNLYGKGEKVEGEEDAYIYAGHKSVTPHYRRFINSEKLTEELKELGFSIVELVESDGIAVYKDDDPVVVRVVAKKE
eukprot:TRINITY_DN10087_c0_g1_i1.p1 TRINITY_DN10087_c0_g1~~TRINITY_DN10087_c0_g1_i1.p1  ORF type:complete len:226 (+),score=81.36 TRINITY_DN10087_c0_g1_i1:70-747(+)